MNIKNVDPYLYSDCDVLINKKGIKSRELLEQFEADSVSGRILYLHRKGFIIKSIFDIQDIHNFIFGNVFAWAGCFRTITMYKKEKVLSGFSVAYSEAQFIVEDLESLNFKFKSIRWNLLSNEEKVIQVSEIIQELWQIHPFREGNTRTTALFLYFLLKQIGLHVNSNFLGKYASYFRNALVLASIGYRSKKEFLVGIINDIVNCYDKNSDKYKTIDGFDCEKYDYRPHTLEKLKTISSLRDLQK